MTFLMLHSLQQRTTMKKGNWCTLNSTGDLMMEAEAKPFINQLCIFIKVTRAGLYQVMLNSDRRKVYSAPKRNISPIVPYTLEELKEILTGPPIMGKDTNDESNNNKTSIRTL